MAEHRQKARWRLIGALLFAVVASMVAYSVLHDTPRPLARDFAILMPKAAHTPSTEITAVPAAPAPEPAALSAPAAQAPLAVPAEQAPALVPPPTVTPDVPVARQVFVQVGAYSTRASADQVKKRLESAGHKVVLSTVGTGSAQRHRVRIGPLSEEDASGVVARAKLQGYDAAVVKGTLP